MRGRGRAGEIEGGGARGDTHTYALILKCKARVRESKARVRGSKASVRESKEVREGVAVQGKDLGELVSVRIGESSWDRKLRDGHAEHIL